MKFKNKLLLIIILFLGLFIVFNNKSFALVLDFDYYTFDDEKKTVSYDLTHYTYTLPNFDESLYYYVLSFDSSSYNRDYRAPNGEMLTNDVKIYFVSKKDADSFHLSTQLAFGQTVPKIYAYKGGDKLYDPWTYSTFQLTDSICTIDFIDGLSGARGYQYADNFMPEFCSESSINFEYINDSGNSDLDYDKLFRGAGSGSSGGAGGGFDIQNPYGDDWEESVEGDDGEFVDSDFEDSTDGGWLNKLISWLKAPFKKLAEILAKIYNFFLGFLKSILGAFFDLLKIAFVPNPDDLIIDDVRATIYNKFPIIESFRQILSDFNSAFDKETGCPNFEITLPAFLGGGSYSIIDFSFYNNYRGIINGIIIATTYFFFIRKVYKQLPTIIKN